MFLVLSAVLPSIIGLVRAFPPPTPVAVQPRQAASSPKPSGSVSVGLVTIEYISGSKTVDEVQTYTDYGTNLPPDIASLYGDATGTGLPRETDPCGPVVQDGHTPPTCSTTNSTDSDSLNAFTFDADYIFQSDAPATYGVQCQNSTRSPAAINTKSCRVTTVDICHKISSKYSPQGKWVWSTVGGPGCAIGYWLPASNGSAPPPDRQRCEQGIYGSMVDLCVTEPDWYFYGVSNLMTVNIVNLPDATGTGSQVNSGYPSYIVAPEPLK